MVCAWSGIIEKRDLQGIWVMAILEMCLFVLK